MNDELTGQISINCEGVLDALVRSLQSHVLVSQDRCVDGLLDVYNAAPTAAVRDLVVAALDDIRHVTAVRTVDLERKLNAIATALAIESALAEISDPLEDIVADC